ncbi:MAG: BON domain-containing protein [Isosphaeraceae bacterium]
MNDLELRRHVEDELEWKPNLDASHIGVVVRDRVVTLSGYVPTYGEKQAVERIIQQVRGVVAIANEIEVRMPGDPEPTDAEIAWAAVDALNGAVSDARDRIKISVNKGWVCLRGDLDSDAEKAVAEDAVRSLPGVQGVIDRIAVMARAAAIG